MLLLSSIIACLPASAERPHPSPDAALPRVCATLAEATRLDAAGHQQESIEAWERARNTYLDALSGPIEADAGPREVLRIDYRFGLMRAQIDRDHGRTAQASRPLRDHLIRAVEALPEPTDP